MNQDSTVGPVADRVHRRVAGADLLARTARYIERDRLSGSPAEAAVLERIALDLEASGLSPSLEMHRALTSRPGRALVRVGGTVFPGVAAVFSAPASDRRGRCVWAQPGQEAAYASRVVLRRGLPSPEDAILLQATGAAAAVYLLPDKVLHMLGVSPVWGSPTPWTVGNLPDLPVALLAGPVADAFASLVGEDPSTTPGPQVSLTAGVDTRWRDVPLLTADLRVPGQDGFVLAGGHVDAWFDGAMDNAAGTAVLVEMAAALAAERVHLRRGVRFAFWSGGADANYAGSQAYADARFSELAADCALYLGVVAPGGRGNDDLAAMPAMAQTAALVRRSVRAVTGSDVETGPLERGADQSFWGIGVPTGLAAFGRRPPDEPWPAGSAWRGPDDTVDGLDPALLARDGAIAAHMAATATAQEGEPIDLAEAVADAARQVRGWQARLRGRVDLRLALDAADDLERAVAGLGSGRRGEENRRIRAVGRLLVRLRYTAGSRFEPDPNLPLVPLPSLASLEAVSEATPGSAPESLAHVAAGRAAAAVAVTLAEAAAIARGVIREGPDGGGAEA